MRDGLAVHSGKQNARVGGHDGWWRMVRGPKEASHLRWDLRLSIVMTSGYTQGDTAAAICSASGKPPEPEARR
jgi:hypothetical protein